jgi:hypothetical protein
MNENTDVVAQNLAQGFVDLSGVALTAVGIKVDLYTITDA